MKKISFSIGVFAILSSVVTSAAVKETSLIEELTGKKVAVRQNLKNAPLSVRHYQAGRDAAAQKNYILAIKHYNTVIKSYPGTKEARASFVEKARVYKEMGLRDQAIRNIELAKKITPAVPSRVGVPAMTAQKAAAINTGRTTK